MLEKGTILRRLLCLTGWHQFTEYQKEREDHTWKAVIPFILLFASGAVLILNVALFLSGKTGKVFGPVTLGIWSAIFIVCLLYLPRGIARAEGPFDGICIYCHKSLTLYTEAKNKANDNAQYESALTEIAKEAYKQKGLPLPEDETKDSA